MNRVRLFYEELKRRRVLRVATLYVIIFWPIIQLVDILSPALNLPDSMMRYLVVAFFGALPVALILAWLFDLDRDGLHIDNGEANESILGSKTEFGIVGFLAVVVTGLFFVQMATDDSSPITSMDSITQNQAGPVTATNANSLAVLPFESFSNIEEDEYFADGLTEELLNVLSRITDLRVAARTTSFAYKGVNKDTAIIGKELNVSYILEGSVRRNDLNNTIRVTAQLIDVAAGAHLWSKTFDRQFTDLFRIQDDISAAVAESLELTLLGNASSIPSTSTSPTAMIAFSMGQEALAKRTEEGLKDAVRYFQRAIDEDPEYALAYTGLADSLTLQMNYRYIPKAANNASAQAAIDKALSLDPNLGNAWASKGLWLSQQKGKIEQAKSALQRAMELNPSYGMAAMWYAGLLENKEEQLTYYEKASALDPKSTVAAYNVASLYQQFGRDHEAMQMFTLMISADPYYPKAYELAARISNRRGRIGEAISNYKTSYELQPNAEVAMSLAKIYSDIGEFTQADEWFSIVEPQVPVTFKNRFLWLKVSRYVAANDMIAANTYLDKIINLTPTYHEDMQLQFLSLYYQEQYTEALALYKRLQTAQLPINKPDGFSQSIQMESDLGAVDLLIRNKEKVAADLLLTELTQQLDDRMNTTHRSPDPSDWYQRARIAALQNNEAMALIHLQRAVDEGWREFWRTGHDPAMELIINHKSFQTMMAGLQNRLSIIREQFAIETEFDGGWGA
jgi:TolB-like protein/tetratricopeptide (TPR) repeat protein